MALVHLWDTFTGPFAESEPFDGNAAYGNAFRVTTDCAIVGLRWYNGRVSGTAVNGISVELWDVATGDRLASEPYQGETAFIGWHEYTLATPVQCYAGQFLRLSKAWDNAGTQFRSYTFVDTGSLVAPPSQFAWLDPAGYYYQGSPGTGHEPNTSTANVAGVDVTVDTSSPPPAPVTDASVKNDLAAWLLATGDNTHQLDGLPWLTKAVVDAIQTVVNNVPQAGSPAWVKALNLWEIAGALSNVEIAAWNVFAQRSPSQLTGATAGGGSAFYSSDGRQVAQSAADTLDLLAALRTPFGSAPWAQADETAWDTALAWPVPADLYVVSTTTIPPNVSTVDVAGVEWRPRLFWWASLNGTFAGERHFADFPSSHLSALPQRLPGLLIGAQPGTAGTVQAWRVTT